MANRFAVATGNWSSSSTWSTTDGGGAGAAAPTASDDVFLTATSGSINVTIDAASACRSLDCTGYTGTLTHAAANTLAIGTTTANGSLALKFVPTMTYAFTGSPTSAQALINLVSTSATQVQITTAGKTVNALQAGAAGGSWILNDALTLAGGLFIARGTLDTNGQTVSALYFSGSGANARALTLGASTLTFTGSTSNKAWDFGTTTNLTFSGASSTITCSGPGVSFVGGGLTYGTVNLTGTGIATVTGANTFATLSRSNAAAVTLTLPASTTQTVTALSISGSSGNLVTLNSSSSGTAATISKSSGTVTANWVSIKDSTASGGATFNATNATNVSGNTGWIFLREFAATINGASTFAAATNAPGVTKAFAASIAGSSALRADINWVKPGKGGIGG